MNMAYDAAHGVQLGRYLVKLAAVVNFQLPRLVVLTHFDAGARDEEARIGAVDKILLGLNTVILSLYGFPCHGQN